MFQRDRPQMMRRCTICTADARLAWIDQLLMRADACRLFPAPHTNLFENFRIPYVIREFVHPTSNDE